MKKIKILFVITLLFMFVGILNTNAESVPITNEQSVESTKDGIIKLEGDTTLTSLFETNSDITVIDLNNHTLTLKAPISVISSVEIKNGTIERELNYNSGSLINAKGNDVVLTLNNVILDGKDVVTNVYAGLGGTGVQLTEGASILANNTEFKNNNADGSVYNGAAIKAENAKSIILNNSKIYNNSAYGRAAALYVTNAEEIELNNVLVENNVTPVQGLTIMVAESGKFTLDSKTIIRNNEGAEGAGVYITNTNSTIEGTIENNNATGGNGGGLYTSLTNSTKTVIVGSTAIIKNNQALEAGGGIYVNGGTEGAIPGKVIINGALVEGNKALGTPAEETLKDGGGAGIYVARGELEINDVTIKNNISDCGFGDAIIVSHHNRNINGGKLTINGGNITGDIKVGIGALNIKGGTYTVDVKDYVTSEYNIASNNGYYVVSENRVLENKETNITFESDSILNKNYILNVILLKKEKHEKVETLVKEKVKENKKIMDTKLLSLFDINIKNGDEIVNVENGSYTISIKLEKDLLIYDNYQVVYIDDEGNIKETLDAKLEDGKVVFNTSHLSTYGVVGFNDVVETINPPKTLDSVTMFVATGIISALGLVLSATYLRKRVLNKIKTH